MSSVILFATLKSLGVIRRYLVFHYYSIIKGVKTKNQKCHTNEDHERCTKQLVEIVAMNVKYHSNQEIIDQFIAQTASKTIKKISKDYKK